MEKGKRARRTTWLKMACFYLSPFAFYPLPSVHANGLSTSFYDVKVQHVKPGQPYDITAQIGKRLDFRNLGDQSLTITIVPLKPTVEQLKERALAIPDTQWVDIKPTTVAISPHSTAYADVWITVPKIPAYRRKTFQVMLWSRGKSTDVKGGVILSPALLSRLQFTTD